MFTKVMIRDWDIDESFASHASFDCGYDADDGHFNSKLLLTWEDWHEMGEPFSINVTIEPIRKVE